jgi:hypothetical protein
MVHISYGMKMQSYCEVIAAIKVRTSNKKGRHLSTQEAIRLIEEFGVETPEGLARAPKSTEENHC